MNIKLNPINIRFCAEIDNENKKMKKQLVFFIKDCDEYVSGNFEDDEKYNSKLFFKNPASKKKFEKFINEVFKAREYFLSPVRIGEIPVSVINLFDNLQYDIEMTNSENPHGLEKYEQRFKNAYKNEFKSVLDELV